MRLDLSPLRLVRCRRVSRRPDSRVLRSGIVTLLVSVPYALKAADAETVGGKPVSAFVLAGNTTGTGADGSAASMRTRLNSQGRRPASRRRPAR
jgi:hypothetical protein